MLCALIVLFAVVLAVAAANATEGPQTQYYSAVCNHFNAPVNGLFRTCEVVKGRDSMGSHANGVFLDEVETTGWGKLWIHGDNTLQGSYEGGFVEGTLTQERIYQHYVSWYSKTFPSTGPTASTLTFMRDNYQFMLDMANSTAKPEQGITEQYLNHLRHTVAQFQGIVEGYNSVAPADQPMSLDDFLFLEAAGDMYDIIPATNPASFKLQVGKLSKGDFEDEFHKMVSCSAIIKIADDNSDCWFGHTTWTHYANMLRIYKNYDMMGGKYQVSFSAKPGSLYSKDDFYILPKNDQRMGVMETTNGVLDSTLYKLVTPSTLLTWTRMPLANGIATSGKQWTEIFSVLQSGTYCNQYMVVDMKKFEAGKGAAPKDFVWIVEVIPGTAISHDVTPKILSQGGYWPSYNVPYDKTIYEVSGFQAAYNTYGDSYSYTNCTRAQLMRRDHAALQSIEAVGAELRQNNYVTDPLSKGDPMNAISCRKDLRTTSGAAFGGIDSKVSSFSRLGSLEGKANKMQGTQLAQSGPTHDSLAPFAWSTANPDMVKNEIHLGQPDLFNFPFVEIGFYEH
jgi:hypothetical protein